MTTLTKFLLERIAEDEQHARACRGPDWHVLDHTEPKWGADDGEVELLGGGKPLATFTDYGRWVESHHIERHDPARVLAECEVKRWLVSTFGVTDYERYDDPQIMKRLALPYRDHPDYQPGWAPADTEDQQ